MKFKLSFLFVLALLFDQALAQVTRNGSPFIDYYRAKDYNAHPQNFSVEEAEDGLMYFGNNDGVLEFDGEYWRLFFTELASPVFSVFRSTQLGIFYCGYDEFGLIKKDSLGRSYCKSIYRDEEANTGRFVDVFEWNNQVYSYSETCIIRYDAEHTDTIYPQFGIFSFFPLGNKLYTQDLDGAIYEFVEGSFIAALGTGLEEVYDIQKSLDAKILVARNALYVFRSNRLHRWYTEIDYVMERSAVLDVFETSEHSFWVSLQGEGLFLIDAQGRLLEKLGRRNGLRDLVNKSMLSDRFGALWLASYNGLMRVNFELGLKKYGQEEGLYGGVESMCITSKGPVVGTSEGVFFISTEASKHQSILSDESELVQAIPKLSMQCWSLIPHPRKANHVLAAMNDGLYAINLDDLSYSLVLECYPWTIVYDSLLDVVLLGLDPGLMLFKPEELSKPIDIKEIEKPITCIQKDAKGAYWLSANQGVLYRLELTKDGEGMAYQLWDKSEKTGLGDKAYRVLVHDQRVYLYGILGFYQYDVARDTAIYKDDMGFINSKLYIHRASVDEEGMFWLAAANDVNRKFIGRFNEASGFDYGMFEPIADAMPQVIIPVGGQEVWLGNNNGLFVFRQQAFRPRESFSSYIRLVGLGGGRVLSHGANNSPLLDYSQNKIYFKFSALKVSESGEHWYSYQLKGYEDAWSEWSTVPEVNFTNLESGSYELRLKSKNLYGLESSPTNFSFTIDTPWYQSPWYYLGQAMFFLFLIVLTYLFSRTRASSTYSELLILVTVITLFEFVILYLEPYVDNYANGVPIFKLAMNIALALSLHPMERLFRRLFNKKQMKA